MIGGVVLEVWRRPINAWLAAIVRFIVKPAQKTVQNGYVDILGSVERFEGPFELGKRLDIEHRG